MFLSTLSVALIALKLIDAIEISWLMALMPEIVRIVLCAFRALLEAIVERKD